MIICEYKIKRISIKYFRNASRQRIISSTFKKFSSEAKLDIKLSDSCVKRLKELCQDGSFRRVIVEVRTNCSLDVEIFTNKLLLREEAAVAFNTN